MIIDRTNALRRIDKLLNALTHENGAMVALELKTPENHLNELVCKTTFELWDRLLSDCGGYASGKVLVPAEKALAELIRRGTQMENIKSRYAMEIRLKMQNFNYVLRKEYQCFQMWPEIPIRYHTHNKPMRWVSLSPQEFGDFMYEFDDLIPIIRTKAEAAMIEMRSRAMQTKILKLSLESYDSEFLAPNSTEYTIRSINETSANIVFRQMGKKDLYLNVPFADIGSTIASIPEKMARQPSPSSRGNR